MLTRKVYNKLAAIIHDVENNSLRARIAREMAGVLKENNPNFNYSKWYNACDVSED